MVAAFAPGIGSIPTRFPPKSATLKKSSGDGSQNGSMQPSSGGVTDRRVGSLLASPHSLACFCSSSSRGAAPWVTVSFRLRTHMVIYGRRNQIRTIYNNQALSPFANNVIWGGN